MEHLQGLMSKKEIILFYFKNNITEKTTVINRLIAMAYMLHHHVTSIHQHIFIICHVLIDLISTTEVLREKVVLVSF